MRIKRNIFIMYAISLLSGMVFYGPIATLYRQAAGVNIFEITLIESISMALRVALELPCGMLADRIGYKNMMMGCCGLYFVSKIVFWRAAGFWAFLAERVMLSAVMAGLSGLDVSILYLSCGSGESQREFGVYNNLGTAGLLIAAGIYSVFIGDNYRLAGFLTVLSYGAAAVLACGLEDVKPADADRGAQRREFKKALSGVLKDREMLMFVLAIGLLGETHQTVTVFLNQLQYTKCGLTNEQIGAVYIAVTVAGLGGGFSARFTGKLGERKFGACCLPAVPRPAPSLPSRAAPSCRRRQ
jgi:MFS family permease